MNGICLFCGPLWSLQGHIFRFFVSRTGPEEIVPKFTRKISGIVKKIKVHKKSNSINFFLGSRSKFFWVSFIKFPDIFFPILFFYSLFSFRHFSTYFRGLSPPPPYKIQEIERYVLEGTKMVYKIRKYHSPKTKPQPKRQG